MKRLTFFSLTLLLLLSACGSPAATEAPALPFVVTIAPEVQPFTPLQSPAPTQKAPAQKPAAAPTQKVAKPLKTQGPLATATLPANTPTPAPSLTAALATPTETLLPALELPTERSFAPARIEWTGLPTYPADSDPGLLFKMDYDPDLWAQTEGNFGEVVLGNRNIPYCTVSPWSGRGLPGDWKVEHEFRYIGSASFDVNTVTYNGELKFVSYVGGDRRILTGFQVAFNEQKEQCLSEAEAIFGTLRSFTALPTPTPLSATPTP